jgi:hypothetical protein
MKNASSSVFRARYLVVGFALLSACSIWPGGAFAWKPVRQLTHEEVAQVWVGLSADELELFRLDLQESGTGTGGFVFVANDAVIFRISRWHYEGKKLEIYLVPEDGAKTGFTELRGLVVGTKMELTLRGTDWKHELSLRPEQELESRWQRLKAAMVGPRE